MKLTVEQAAQSAVAVQKNRTFFLENIASYRAAVERLDSYAAIRRRVNHAVQGVDTLLDIGNGGVFDYDTSLVRHITALDLFFDGFSAEELGDVFPANVTPRTGSALAIPFEAERFDAVLMVMLLHHLVGRTVAQCLTNVRTALTEAVRVLRPGGRLIIVESCVPRWFYGLERLVYRPAAAVIGATMGHPPVLQYPARLVRDMVTEVAGGVQAEEVPLGRWVLQFGVKWPSALTPVSPYLFSAAKRG